MPSRPQVDSRRWRVFTRRDCLSSLRPVRYRTHQDAAITNRALSTPSEWWRDGAHDYSAHFPTKKLKNDRPKTMMGI